MSSLFTQIINKEQEGTFLYEDDLCVVIMDLFPFKEGHMLVIPREEKERVRDLPSKTVGHLFQVAQKMIQAIEACKEIQSEAFNLFLSEGKIAGQEIPHVHLHILPRYAGDGLRFNMGVSAQQAERQELVDLAEKIKPHLK